MAFNPLKEKGRPIEEQFMDWDRLNVQPYNKFDVHPYTRTRIILMNGIEVESAMFAHQLARHCPDQEIRRLLAAPRRVEQQQQKIINWLSPGDETILETTIGYEQVAVDLTAWLARTEPDVNVKAALDFALIEDFDHLYRYANLLDLRGIPAERICGGYTEIFPGRPTVSEHRHPFDSLPLPGDAKTASPLSLLHINIIVAAEQQTMNYYMNVGPAECDQVTRALYQEIGMIEEQHVSHYESLIDPTSTWWERLLMHEYTECYMYYSCLKDETDRQIKLIWEMFLEHEIEHLKMAAELFQKYDGRDAAEIIPDDFPELVKFEPNKEYVREIVKTQVDWTANEHEYVPVSSLPDKHRFFRYQQTVNSETIPSNLAIETRVLQKGEDYRYESDGQHPVERFRNRTEAVI